MAKLENVKTLDMVNGEITKVSYGRAEYERVEGAAQVGDIVLVKEAWGSQNVGEFFVVTYTKSGIIDQIVGMDGNTCEASSYKHCLKIFRKVAASTNPSVEERVAKAEGEIESLKSDVAALKGEAEYKRIDVDEAKVGDFVKFDDPPSYLTDKEYYEIKEFEDGDPVIIDDDSDEYDTYTDNFAVYRKVSAESVEAEPKPERLKVGDYAKVVNATDYHKFSDGDIVEILEDSFTHGNNEVARRITDEEIQYVLAKELVCATDEEVAEAKRAAAERKKWAEIGRKVGEYKVGDIVQISDEYDEYGVFGIMDYIGAHFYGVQLPNGTYSRPNKDKVTLITPVEARFDR
ncbi:hypothetical protein [Bacillus sp. AF23]|uniref:hypothetical protein n=1 Tax=Bacillus sp. AF23 TaxID=2821151 RepID=UPI001E450A17|nr:hypothetical protein [Bacillus sp. AF23]MCC8352539.1 hypothetical protein [Bacillus sp. AF23]